MTIDTIDDLWSLPGGMEDKGESLKHAAFKETCEETGIRKTADSRGECDTPGTASANQLTLIAW